MFALYLHYLCQKVSGEDRLRLGKSSNEFDFLRSPCTIFATTVSDKADYRNGQPWLTAPV